MTNTPAYYGTEFITSAKKFLIQANKKFYNISFIQVAPWGLYKKLLYRRNLFHTAVNITNFRGSANICEQGYQLQPYRNGFNLARKYHTWIEDKHSSLLRYGINCDRKKYYDIDLW